MLIVVIPNDMVHIYPRLDINRSFRHTRVPLRRSSRHLENIAAARGLGVAAARSVKIDEGDNEGIQQES